MISPETDSTVDNYPESLGTSISTYDTASCKTGVTDACVQSPKFTYDADGNLVTQTDPNGVSVASTYDANDNPTLLTTTLASSAIASFGYTYNADNLVTSESDTGSAFPTSSPQAYTYTSTNRLGSVNAAPTTYTGAGSLTTLENGTTQTYDAGGELTSATTPSGATTTFSNNTLGERTTTTEPSGDVATSTFNQAGDLTGYTPAADQPTRSSATYTYASDGLLTSETTAAGTATFTWDVATSLPLLLDDGTDAYVYGPGSTPVEEVPLATPSSTTYVIADAQGSVRVQLSATGAVLGSVTYDANGNAESVLGTISSPLGYDGQLRDPASGLLYLRARWYDPTTAQFVSVDPALATTHQAYTYAGDDPVSEVDLAGLQGSAGLSAEQRYRNQVADKCDGHPEREGCQGIDVVGDVAKHWRGILTTAEIAGALACIAATEGVCAGYVAAATFGADLSEDIVENHGNARQLLEVASFDAVMSFGLYGAGRVFDEAAQVEGFETWQRVIARAPLATGGATAAFLGHNG